MEKELVNIQLTKEVFLSVLVDAYNLGNNSENITLKSMLEYLESRLIN